MRRSCIIGVTVSLMSSLTACGGGAGGRTEVASLPPPPKSFTVPPPVTHPTTQDFNTPEYNRSETAVHSNAIGAWQMGASGSDVKIGFVDTGIIPTLDDFAGRIDPASRDVSGSRAMGDDYGHGTAVASIAAGAMNDSGVVGIAYNATIVMMRADAPGSCPKNCYFTHIDAGIDAARLAGARVVNLSIGGDDISSVDDAVRRAAAAGMVIVVGAGNDSSNSPTGFAAGLAKSAPGQVIIVGALGQGVEWNTNYDVLSLISNRPGSSYAEAYIAAPGHMIHGDLRDGAPDFLSGTSFAAPVVAGAIALLAEAFPTLTAQQLVKLLLISADDLGVTGVDPIYGHGRLNIGRAFQPLGATTLAASATPVSLSLNGTTPAVAGDSARRGGLNVIVLDGFGRAFNVDLARTFKASRGASPLASIALNRSRTSGSQIGPVFVGFRLLDGQGYATGALSTDQWREAQVLAGSITLRVAKNTSVGLLRGGGTKELQSQLDQAERRDASFMLTGDVAANLGFVTVGRNAYGVRGGIGPVDVVATSESGRLWSSRADQSPKRYVAGAVAVSRSVGALAATIGVSRVKEDRTVLGGSFDGPFVNAGAISTFVDVSGSLALTRDWSLAGILRRGRTRFAAGKFETSAFAFDITKQNFFHKHDRLTLRLSQPLAVSHGGISMLAPVSYDYFSQHTDFGERRLSLVPTAKEHAIELGYSFAGPRSLVTLNVFARTNPGHVSDTKADVTGFVSWRLRL